MRPNFEGFGSISDLFEAFFGPAFGSGFAATHPGPLQGEDAIVSVEIDLEQAAEAAAVEVAFDSVDAWAAALRRFTNDRDLANRLSASVGRPRSLTGAVDDMRVLYESLHAGSQR